MRGTTGIRAEESENTGLGPGGSSSASSHERAGHLARGRPRCCGYCEGPFTNEEARYQVPVYGQVHGRCHKVIRRTWKRPKRATMASGAAVRRRDNRRDRGTARTAGARRVIPNNASAGVRPRTGRKGARDRRASHPRPFNRADNHTPPKSRAAHSQRRQPMQDNAWATSRVPEY